MDEKVVVKFIGTDMYLNGFKDGIKMTILGFAAFKISKAIFNACVDYKVEQKINKEST